MESNSPQGISFKQFPCPIGENTNDHLSKSSTSHKIAEMELNSPQKQFENPFGEVTNDPPSKPSTSHRNIFLATLAAQLYVVSMGMVSAYSSPAGADMERPGSRLHVTFDEITWIASLPMLSGIFGNAFSGYVSHRFGRKATLMCLSASFTMGWLLIAYAPTVAVVYAGRIVCGISAGMCTVAVPTYVVEISTVEIRGLTTATTQVAVALGAFSMTGFGISLRWSWLAIVGAVTVVLGASILLFMPESPPWLIRASRRDEAFQGITFLKGKNHDAEKEIKEIIEDLADEAKSTFSLKEISNPALYKPLLIAVVVMFNMSFCGFVVILAYSVEVFEITGSSLNPNVAATIVTMVQVLATIASSIFMDRVGRRVLYITSGITMAISLIIFGTYSYFAAKYSQSELVQWSWVPIFSLVAYLATFSIGFGSVPFVVIPELVSTTNRSFVMAVAAVSGSFFGFIIIKIFDYMVVDIGLYGTYWTYAVFTVLGTLFYWIFVPETKGRSIQDIQKSFSAPKIT